MEKDCCEIKVTEIEKGFKIEVTGDEISNKCKTAFRQCCSGEAMKKCFHSFCGTSTPDQKPE